VLGMLETDDFIRCVLLTKDRLPSIILYTERQLHELKTFCFSKSYVSVLTFDKTYNLRSVFVTAAVYKNIAQIRRRTSDSPLFLGPVFIRGQPDFQTYSQFFSNLSGLLS
jgi:hypothetical protein